MTYTIKHRFVNIQQQHQQQQRCLTFFPPGTAGMPASAWLAAASALLASGGAPAAEPGLGLAPFLRLQLLP
jgi:hypothetical protein